MSHQQHRVHPKIWQSCAGDSVKIPKLNSKVYYFPKGHLEHVCPFPTAETISNLHRSRPSFLCRISSVDLLANSNTDEVYAKLTLTVILDAENREPPPPVPIEEDSGDQVLYYAKILTQSDAYCSSFTVPCRCAESIFPNLESQDSNPASEKLSVTDIKGKVWELTYVYSRNPKRHLITTGWSAFSRNKRFIDGDSIVFMKNSTGNIFVGIRRKKILTEEEVAVGVIAGSRRFEKEKLTEQKVLEALDLAGKGMAFEVVYYPIVGWFDFVVDAEIVEKAMNINWCPGMKINLVLNTSESSKNNFFNSKGTILNVANSLHVPMWRMLQVNWNEAEIPNNLKYVNPWQVELNLR